MYQIWIYNFVQAVSNFMKILSITAVRFIKMDEVKTSKRLRYKYLKEVIHDINGRDRVELTSVGPQVLIEQGTWMCFHLWNNNTRLLVFPILPRVVHRHWKVFPQVWALKSFAKISMIVNLLLAFACTYRHTAYLLRDLSRKQLSFIHEWVCFVHGLITSKYLIHITNIYNRWKHICYDRRKNHCWNE